MSDERLEIDQVVYVAVGSRIGELGRVVRHSGTGPDHYVWLEPVGSSQPLGYYRISELSRDGMPFTEGLA